MMPGLAINAAAIMESGSDTIPRQSQGILAMAICVAKSHAGAMLNQSFLREATCALS